MPRLMSVTLTEDAVRAEVKTVTRRLGWSILRPSDELDLCRKVMGRKRADGSVDPLVRIARVRVVDVRREPLDAITDDDVAREGFGDVRDLLRWDRGDGLAGAFVRFFCHHMKCDPGTVVTRVQWEYLPRPSTWPPL